MTVQRHLPRARQEVSFQPLAAAPNQANPPEAAALVELTVDGQRRAVWLQRGDSQYSAQSILTGRGPVLVSLGDESRPLGYSIELQNFNRRVNPGGLGDAAFSSTVRLVDPAAGVDEPREISMNEPLVHGRFRLYQSSFQDARAWAGGVGADGRLRPGTRPEVLRQPDDLRRHFQHVLFASASFQGFRPLRQTRYRGLPSRRKMCTRVAVPSVPKPSGARRHATGYRSRVINGNMGSVSSFITPHL